MGVGVFNTRRFHRNGGVVCSTHQPLVAGESTGLGVGVKAAQNYRGNASNRLHFRAILRFWGWFSKFGVWGSRFWAWGSEVLRLEFDFLNLGFEDLGLGVEVLGA